MASGGGRAANVAAMVMENYFDVFCVWCVAVCARGNDRESTQCERDEEDDGNDNGHI